MGVAVEELPGPIEAETFEVMAQNVPAVRTWLACETQWRVAAGMSGIVWLGLDYGAVDVVLRRLALEKPDEVFADLMVMEAEALSVFREQDR